MKVIKSKVIQNSRARRRRAREFSTFYFLFSTHCHILMYMKSLRRTVFGTNLLFYFSLAITVFINSSFIEKELGEKYVGIIFAISSILTIWAHSNATKHLSRIGGRRYFILFALIQAISLCLIIIPSTNLIQAIAFVFYLTTTNILIFCLDVFFERVMGKHNRGKKRGVFLLLGNMGYVLAPLTTAFLVENFGYTGAYLATLIMITVLIAVVVTRMNNYTDAKYSAHPSNVIIHRVLANRQLRSVIGANFILQFFYAWMVVYAPILLHTHLGLPWKTIGVIFSVMLTTFVILDYPLGRLADKIGSEKELSAIGFIVMAISVFAIAALPLNNVYFIGAIFFFSRIGAATTEAMTEIHFFKTIKDSDSSLISIFRDIRPFAYLIAPIFGALLIPFTPLKSSFAVLGIIMIGGFFISLKMEKRDKWWEKAHES